MDEATREQIADPFFTTKEKGKGTALKTGHPGGQTLLDLSYFDPAWHSDRAILDLTKVHVAAS